MPSKLGVAIPTVLAGATLPAWAPFETVPGRVPLLGAVSPAFVPLVVLSGLLGGWLMYESSVASVFYVGGAFALTGVGSFLVILLWFHGTAALTEW